MPANPGGATGSEATGTEGEHAPTVTQLGKPVTEQVTLLTDSVPELLHWKLPANDIPTTPDNGTVPGDADRLTVAAADAASPVAATNRKQREMKRMRCAIRVITGKPSTSLRS